VDASLKVTVRHRHLQVLVDALGMMSPELIAEQLRWQRRKRTLHVSSVDTSVWIHALQPVAHPSIRILLRPLIASEDADITDWILLELMTGLLASERKEALLQ
jgi:hypothetical protein